jgi:3-deoxy-manno-octulosonate cytidylyltransferase (CMP-KDO synthetase)
MERGISKENAMKVVCMIPARYGSRRFEGKALADLDGKPMIQHVYERAAAAANLDGIAVVTDDLRISDAVKSFGGKVLMTSPELMTGTDRIAEAVEFLGLGDEDIVVNVQGDQPCISPQHIEQVAALLLQDPAAVMATLAFKIEEVEDIDDPNAVKVVFDNDFNAIYFSRSPIPYMRGGSGYPAYFKHQGIYAYRRWFLRLFAELAPGSLELAESLEQLRAVENGYLIKVALTEIDSPSVDTLPDLVKVRGMIAEHGGCAG